MTDVLSDSLAEKIAHLLVMALSPSATPGERENAARLFWQTLESVDPGAHALSERLHLPVASDEEMQKVFDAGREHEAGQSRAVAVTPKPFFTSGAPQSGYSRAFDDHDRIAGSETFNGFRLGDIARHCAGNLHRIPDKHHSFLEDMAGKLAHFGGTISGAQMRYLVSLFRQYLGGAI